MISPKRRHSFVDIVLAGFALLGLVAASIAILLRYTAISTRSLWIDEFVNFEKIWQQYPYWLGLFSLPETLYLAPLRFLQADALSLTIAYRHVSFAVAICVFLLALGAIYRRTRNIDVTLFAAAGIGSLLLYVGYAFVARPYVIGLAGVLLLSVDRWKSWLSRLGFALALFHTMTSIFALAVVAMYVRPWRRAIVWLAAIGGAYILLPVHWLAPEALGELERPIVATFKQELHRIVADLPPTRIVVQQFPFTGVSALASALALTAFNIYASRGRRPFAYIPLVYLAAVVALRQIDAPMMGRFVAPAAIWAWVNFSTCTLRNLKVPQRRLLQFAALLLIVVQIVDLNHSPLDRHWEPGTTSSTATELEAVRRHGCHVRIEADKAVEIMTALSHLLQFGIWQSPRPALATDGASTGCRIDIDEPLGVLYFDGQDDRFVRMFAGVPRLSRPTLILVSLDRSDQGQRALYGYGSRVVAGLTVYALEANP